VITYCTNIHPGESWDEIFSNLNSYALKIKKTVCPEDSFPIGLRLSNLASLELDYNTSAQFLDWCMENDCYVPTINGFPYGSFHSTEIKEKVYIPDWRSTERIDYTIRLAGLLDAWLPSGITGSISTVPIGFKKHIVDKDYNQIKQNLVTVLEHFARIKQKSGKEILLSLETEPGCVLETTADVITFFEHMKFPEELRECIGVCFDCCHHAVEFENPAESLTLLSEAGIKIGKVQVSSALSMKNFDSKSLKKFSEPCYLHQVVIRREDGSLIRYNDIQEVLDNHQKSAEEELRIHFHIPVFIESVNGYETTRSFIENIIPLVQRNLLLEVETYTWYILPPELQMDSVTDSIIREIQWVKSQTNE
jgi:sugar phosphate isomerase/epimerase